MEWNDLEWNGMNKRRKGNFVVVPGSEERERSCGTCRDRYRSSGTEVEVAGLEVRVPLTVDGMPNEAGSISSCRRGYDL